MKRLLYNKFSSAWVRKTDHCVDKFRFLILDLRFTILLQLSLPLATAASGQRMSGSQKRRRNSHFCHGQLSSRQTTLSTETTTPTATVASATTKSSYNLIYGINTCRSNLVRQTKKKGQQSVASTPCNIETDIDDNFVAH